MGQLALRHTLTSREFLLTGPGRILPCRNGAEQVLLARGQISTSANLGVRPGAEVLIAAPVALVRYGDAALDAAYDERGLRVLVRQGEAWMDPERSGRPPLPNPLRAGAEVRLGPGRGDPDAAVLACRVAAESARERAARVLGSAPTAEGSLGERAAAHVLARKNARAACAIAAAALGAVTDPARSATLEQSVADSEQLWQRVPHP